MKRALLAPALVLGIAAVAGAQDKQDKKIRVLYVGGDWKAQLPNFKTQDKTVPMRGYFVQQEVEKAAPGRFEITLWTSYEFLQYGDAESLKPFDVIVAGDVMGQSVVPRLVKGLTDFVEGGGGFWYCDNHKAFSFIIKERSFDGILPIETVLFRPYGPDPPMPQYVPGLNKKTAKEYAPLKVKIIATDLPMVKGLSFDEAPPLKSARYGKVKDGAKVVAVAPDDSPIWVVWQKGKGRALWTGGVFANDEASADFSTWSRIGQFYAQTLAYLAEGSSAPRTALQPQAAEGALTVDLSKKGPEISARHFSIHGNEGAGVGSEAERKLYQALNLDGGFARTGAGQIIKQDKASKGYMDDGTDLTTFDWSKYEANQIPKEMERLKAINAVPIFMNWIPWGRSEEGLDPGRYTKYNVASLLVANGKPGTPEYKMNVEYLEPGNEPGFGPADSNSSVEKYIEFINYMGPKIHAMFPGTRMGCLGSYEWTYVQKLIDRAGRNVEWISRHPYGRTGESVMYLHDQYVDYARKAGLANLKFIITEWDFWIYGEPAFDYIMQRWKPLVDRADTCLGSLHYRWTEYQEGGYVFGVFGGYNTAYGQLPPEWPNPGKFNPITYRYNAFWAMRDCRGTQYAVELKVPDVENADSHRAYGVATCNGKQFNIVAYYGYPYQSLQKGKAFNTLKLHISAAIPPEVKGRSLVVSRADCRKIDEAPARQIQGDKLELDVELPARGAISLTVR